MQFRVVVKTGIDRMASTLGKHKMHLDGLVGRTGSEKFPKRAMGGFSWRLYWADMSVRRGGGGGFPSSGIGVESWSYPIPGGRLGGAPYGVPVRYTTGREPMPLGSSAYIL